MRVNLAIPAAICKWEPALGGMIGIKALLKAVEARQGIMLCLRA